jgi:hypothetical protein
VNRNRLDPARSFARIVFNERLLLVAHIVLGGVATAAYLTRIDFTGFHYWGRGGSWGTVIMSVPPILPYFISGIFSRKFEDPSRAGPLLFVCTLTVGTVIAAGWFLRVRDFGVLTVFCATFAQVLCYTSAASLFLHGPKHNA